MDAIPRLERIVSAPPFTAEDAARAHEDWGANCGPGALAAIMKMTFAHVRPHMGEFEKRGYTTTLAMEAALRSIGQPWHRADPEWPTYGLARIQWCGPWMDLAPFHPGRVRQSHWVAAARRRGKVGVFDINAMENGTGWGALVDWESVIVPHILRECVPRANGKWFITNAFEVG